MLNFIGYLFVAFFCYFILDLGLKILQKRKIVDEFQSFEKDMFTFSFATISLTWIISIPIIVCLTAIILFFWGASILSDKVVDKIEEKFKIEKEEKKSSIPELPIRH